MRFGVVLPIQDVQEPLDVLLDQLRAEVRAADEAGFDAFFLPEFHQTRAGGVISPLLAGAALAEGTRRIRAGQAVVPGPLYHPVRLAEDVAMLSWLTRGRALLGVGVGHLPADFELYDVERGTRFGTKIWSTTAHVADRIMVTARTREDPKPSRGLTIFLVDRSSPGLTATPIPKIGMRSLGSCEVVFDDVFVPEEDVLGEVGEGWRQVTSSLNAERVMVAAMCTGILQGVLEDAVAYASQRHAFGKPIGQMQAIQHGIADELAAASVTQAPRMTRAAARA